MRNWKPVEPPRDIDPRVYAILKRITQYISQSQAGFARLDAGTTTDGSSSQIGARDHGELDGLVPEGSDTNDDHSQYALLAGRSGGQSLLGDSATGGATSTTPALTFANYNLAGGSGAQRITLQGGGASTGKIKVETAQLQVVERGQSTGFDIFGGSGFTNVQNNGNLSVFGASGSSPVVGLYHSSAGLAAHTLEVKARSSQTGRLTAWKNSADTIMSYIRASDGAFVGPVEPSSGAVPTTRQINTTAPLTGGGALSSDLTLDVDVFTSSTEGTVPASGGGTANFLRADGTWNAPPGGAGGTPSFSRTFAFMGA